ncbi:hypothetical protein [Clostridium sp. UBA1056]|uniref:hypothetical protein n=1 Tax=unclassified Clostridium TaxID=2614128 RepID=UPI003217ADC0
MSVASLVLGICSIVFTVISWGCLWWLSLVLGVVGIVLGFIDMKKKKEAGVALGMAKGGFICSIIGICMAIIFLIFIIGVASLGVALV